jgi:signal transduction histidine kinase
MTLARNVAAQLQALRCCANNKRSGRDMLGVPLEQAGWLEVLGAISASAIVAAACWLVVRHRERRCNERARLRIIQRTREARALHDALLQDFQGVLLKVHAAASLLPHRAAEARALLEQSLSQADQTIAEARDAVQAMGAAIDTDVGTEQRRRDP